MIYLLLISIFVSLILTPFFKKVGEKYGFCDLVSEDPLKIHQKAISYLGGLAILLTAIVLFFVGMVFEKSFNWQIFGIITGGIIVFLIGFWDDFKWKKERIKPAKKFLFLILFSILTAIVLLVIDIKIQFFPVLWLSFPLTFFYILGAINAINFEDGIDGLAGGLVGISLIGFIILAIILGQSLALVISLVLLGAILGFLIFNFPPAKIFMGDSGAYFLGFILIVLASIFSKPFDVISIAAPILIIGLPVFDTGLTILRRILQRKSPFFGDRAHFFDRIIQRGFSTRKTVLFSYFLQLILVVLGVTIYLNLSLNIKLF